MVAGLEGFPKDGASMEAYAVDLAVKTLSAQEGVAVQNQSEWVDPADSATWPRTPEAVAPTPALSEADAADIAVRAFTKPEQGEPFATDTEDFEGDER